jgi:predicted lipoprotein with Yx(FWY)xxD motif
MNRNSIVWIVVAFAIIAGVVYVANRNTPASQPAKAYVLKTATNTEVGAYLVSSTGMTLYTFANDKPGVSNCVDACATNWPPYVATDTAPFYVEAPVVGTVSSFARADGTAQLTYNGMPLYFWKNDMKPGDTTGQNFNKVWFVVKP